MKELLIIITAFTVLAMIVCSELRHENERHELEWQSAYWKSLFIELLKKYRMLKKELEKNADK